jgi:hypothetical protein
MLCMQAILTSEFGRQPLIIPNGVDCHRFTPGPRSRLAPTSTVACVPSGRVRVTPKPCTLVARTPDSLKPLKWFRSLALLLRFYHA